MRRRRSTPRRAGRRAISNGLQRPARQTSQFLACKPARPGVESSFVLSKSAPSGQSDRGVFLLVRLRCLRFRLAGAALALACGLLSAPAAVHADCATHLPDLSRITLPFSQPPSHASPSHGAPSAPDSPKPCSGPNCSSHRSPAPLPMAPPPGPPPHGEEWGCLLALTPRPGAACARLFDAAAGRPVRRGASVFHPPRLSSCFNPL